MSASLSAIFILSVFLSASETASEYFSMSVSGSVFADKVRHGSVELCALIYPNLIIHT